MGYHCSTAVVDAALVLLGNIISYDLINTSYLKMCGILGYLRECHQSPTKPRNPYTGDAGAASSDGHFVLKISFIF
nr:hypothetical protein CFP56_06557 [Quercus suber]